MANNEVIEKLENIINELETKLGIFFDKQTLPKIICTLELYNYLCIDFYLNRPKYLPDFYYHINNGITEVIKYYFSLQKKNLFYRFTDKVSEPNRRICYDTLMDFAFLREMREYYYISDIEINEKQITIKPFTSNYLEIEDFYRDQNFYFNSSLNDLNKSIFSQINNDRDKLFIALSDFYKYVIESSGVTMDAKFGGLPYVSYVTAIFYLITISTEHSNLLIDRDFSINRIKICDTYSIKKDMLNYINEYQKKLYVRAIDLSATDVDKIFDVISINFDNYETAIEKGHIDRLFIQLNNKLSTFITHYAPTEYLSTFSYLNRLLCSYFPEVYNKNRDNRENIMFAKLHDCISSNKIEVKQGIKIRDNGKTLTDIDSVIYDQGNNTCYFLQFKYQDDFVRDVKTKKNQIDRINKQIEQWFNSINIWLKNHSLERFLKDSHFKNVKATPKLKFIIFTQYNINQLLISKLNNDTIYVSDSLFYETYKQTANLHNLFNKIYKQNRKPIEEPEHNNAECYIMDYKILYDYGTENILKIQNRWHEVDDKNAIDVVSLLQSF